MMCSYFCQRKFLWEANIAQLVILNLALVTVRIEICWKWANVRIWYLKYLEVGIVMQTREETLSGSVEGTGWILYQYIRLRKTWGSKKLFTWSLMCLPVCFIELSTSVCNFRLCDIFNLFVLLYENQLYAWYVKLYYKQERWQWNGLGTLVPMYDPEQPEWFVNVKSENTCRRT